jgi:hypothetical protein
MKKKFYEIAKRLRIGIINYKTYVEPGSGGLQVFHLEYVAGGKTRTFDDSYFHLSGDAHKGLEMIEIEATAFCDTQFKQP